MSAHAWVPHPDSETIRRPFQRIRVCTVCGKEQEWTQDHEWMRVVRSYWYPKVGRCHPVAFPNRWLAGLRALVPQGH